jgi:hypothetical protein
MWPAQPFRRLAGGRLRNASSGRSQGHAFVMEADTLQGQVVKNTPDAPRLLPG